jgi:hypothetical protein
MCARRPPSTELPGTPSSGRIRLATATASRPVLIAVGPRQEARDVERIIERSMMPSLKGQSNEVAGLGQANRLADALLRREQSFGIYMRKLQRIDDAVTATVALDVLAVVVPPTRPLRAGRPMSIGKGAGLGSKIAVPRPRRLAECRSARCRMR